MLRCFTVGKPTGHRCRAEPQNPKSKPLSWTSQRDKKALSRSESKPLLSSWRGPDKNVREPLTLHDIPPLSTGKVQWRPRAAGLQTAAWREGGEDSARQAQTAMPHNIWRRVYTTEPSHLTFYIHLLQPHRGFHKNPHAPIVNSKCPSLPSPGHGAHSEQLTDSQVTHKDVKLESSIRISFYRQCLALSSVREARHFISRNLCLHSVAHKLMNGL